ncbi:hypothetical protein [Gordonia neofelifaecis]|uniref:Uncharacterized protein n=1 Tax=Gordonia neofelifaecis NRRL B-59395 TaxID=644548 RepID=F1YLS5_9ACTN|nr:hypothetical protein [Gordonia neofelifaecis]EGD54469.1 hypothetical protein SCNU_14344 [Gordonia neofelifaecis NRRL B-59395]
MTHKKITPTDIPLLILDDESVAAYAARLAADRRPMAVVSSSYSPVLPFMIGNNGYTVAMVADVNDPIQLADVIDRVQSRLGPISRTVHDSSDLPAA